MSYVMRAIVAGLVYVAAVGPATAADAYTVVVGSLANPRGLTFGPGDRLYVAQAGTGGDSGKITEIRHFQTASPSVRDVVTGLPSVVDEGQFVGIDGISAIGNGTLYGIVALSHEGGADASLLGHLLQVNPAGRVRDIASVGDLDYAWSGDHVNLAPHDFPDANPYAVLALPGHIYVADAGTNTLDLVRPDGTIEILAYFPNNAIADATPTCIAQGPDGALYVGTLAIADSLVTQSPRAAVYRVDPAAADPTSLDAILQLATPWATGVWPINGCAFGPDGTFYASQLFTNPDLSNPQSDVVAIPFANPSEHVYLTDGALLFPAGVAVGPGGVYVSNRSAFFPGATGEVVRLDVR